MRKGEENGKRGKDGELVYRMRKGNRELGIGKDENMIYI